MKVDLFRSSPHALFTNSFLRCEVLTHVRAKQSPSLSGQYIVPKPDKHFPHAFTKGRGCKTQQSRRW